MPDRAQNRDWVREVPDHYRRRGPYEDFGWESRQSVLPEWRDPSVHEMPYDQGQPYRGERRAYGQPYGRQEWVRGPYREQRPEYYSGGGGYSDYGHSGQGRPSVEPTGGYTEPRWAPGPFTGRGPQSYQRSDERIFEDVYERLTQHGQLDASDIQVSVQNGEVTLQGTVVDRRAKHMAEDTVESVLGVKDVHNRLQVQERWQRQPSKQAGA